jgi:hypothetical protein
MNILNFDTGSFEVVETREGFLKAKVTIAKPGVFPYVEDNKLKFYAKLPQDIFSKSTIDSAKGAPVVTDISTKDHPKKGNDYIFVDSENYSDYVMGNISEPTVENGKLVAYETIWDSRLIDEIKQGNLKEVSIGFSHSFDNSPGEYEGKKYDKAQTNIVINHLAHVDKARAGDDIRIHVDRKQNLSEENIMKPEKQSAAGADPKGTPDTKFSYRKFDGSADISVSQEVHTELMSLRNTIKDFQKQVDSYKTQVDDLNKKSESKDKDAEIASLKETVDGWKKQYDDLKNSIPGVANTMAKERTELIEFAKSVDSKIAIDGLTNKEIKLQIISAGLPFASGISVDSLSDEIIEARFDAAKELIKEKANLSTQKTANSFVVDSEEINKKKLAMQNAWEGGK